MIKHLQANLWLLILSVVICCILYPLTLWGIGQIFFRNQASGSLVYDKNGTPVGSLLIAQPFTADEYFQPRPSAVSYNGAASGASNWSANNNALRDRVARQLGPIVKYQEGPKKGQLVASDVESWFQKDQFQSQPGIVAQWAQAHSGSAQNWVKADKVNAAYVTAWQKDHAAEVKQWIEDNPATPEPQPTDLAVAFFTSYSRAHPGTFPGAVEHTKAEGKTEKRIEPVKEGSDIVSLFFDMWRQDHPDAVLEDVPADMVMSSGSGLDPHITLKNALYQLDRVAAKRAADMKRDPAEVRKEISDLLHQKAEAPLSGLAGVPLVNVLEVNLALKDRYAAGVEKREK